MTFLIAFVAAISLAKDNIIVAATMATLPFILLFSIKVLSKPYLCMIFILVSYMINFQIGKWGFTSNLYFVGLIIIAIFSKKVIFKFQVNRIFLLFLFLYISYALFSYFFVHHKISYYEINMYINL